MVVSATKLTIAANIKEASRDPQHVNLVEIQCLVVTESTRYHRHSCLPICKENLIKLTEKNIISACTNTAFAPNCYFYWIPDKTEPNNNQEY